MDSAQKRTTAISAIIPAHNESQTICGVIGPLLGHPLIDEIIVVDDGSTDDTAERARSMGVSVISLPNNRGKASAMARGVQAARNEILFFSDADTIGLTPDRITGIVSAVTTGDYDMFVGVRGRKTYWANRLLRVTPILGGERVLTRNVWNHVPDSYQKNFQIEIALNFFAKHFGHRMGFAVVPGLSQLIKEKKRGLWLGTWQRLSMIYDILLVGWRIYVLLQSRLLARRLLPGADRGIRRILFARNVSRMTEESPIQHQ